VASVKTFIEEDRRRTIRDVVDGTGIALGTVWNIIRKHLHMKRIYARLVPRLTFALVAVVRRRRDVDCDVVYVTPGCSESSLLVPYRCSQSVCLSAKNLDPLIT